MTEEVILRIISAGGTPLLAGVGWIMWKIHLKQVDFNVRLVRIETLLENHLAHLLEKEEGR